MTNDNNDKIIDRVKKLLRKADENQNPSEAERDIAMNMAQKLLMKHGLTMGDVGTLDQDQHDREFIHGGEDGCANINEDWEAVLAHNIAPYFFVSTYRVKWAKDRASVMLMGRREHVAIFTEIFSYVRDQIRGMATIEITRRDGLHQHARTLVASIWSDRAQLFPKYVPAAESFTEAFESGEAITLAQEWRERETADAKRAYIMDSNSCSFHFSKKVESYVKRDRIAPEFVEHLGVWRNSFYDGAIMRLADRIAESQRDAVKDAGEPGMELVTTEREQLDAFKDSLDLNLTSSASKRRSDYSGHAAGRAAADRADIGGRRKVNVGRGQLNA